MATIHAWAAGHGVALASLINIGNSLYGINRQTTLAPRHAVVIETELESVFPIEKVTLDYGVTGSGMTQGALTLTYFAAAHKYVLDTFFSSGAVKSAAMTLLVPRLELGTSDRMSVYLIMPGRDDLEYLRHGLIRATFRYHVVAIL